MIDQISPDDRLFADPAEGAAGVVLVALDGLTALFHRPSGQTHLLAEPAPMILDVLRGSDGLAIAELVQMLGVGGEEAALLPHLEELAAAGLVWRR